MPHAKMASTCKLQRPRNRVSIERIGFGRVGPGQAPAISRDHRAWTPTTASNLMALCYVALSAYALSWTLPSPIVRAPAARMSGFIPEGDNAKQMSSSELITFAGLTDEWQSLTKAALIRLDRNRVLQDKPSYKDINGMIESYVEEADKAGLGWTKQEAESEVVRYLMRQALADEGGLDGDGQDKAAFALLALLLGLGTAQGLSSIGALDAFTTGG